MYPSLTLGKRVELPSPSRGLTAATDEDELTESEPEDADDDEIEEWVSAPSDDADADMYSPPADDADAGEDDEPEKMPEGEAYSPFDEAIEFHDAVPTMPSGGPRALKSKRILYKERDVGWFIAHVERAAHTRCGTENLVVISFEAEEQQQRVLAPALYTACDEDARAPWGAWCVVELSARARARA